MDDVDFTGLLGYLAGVEQRISDPQPLAVDIRQIVIDDNLIARTVGVDGDGLGMIPLRPMTPGQIRRRGGDGPPLAPQGSASRIVTDFQVEAVPVSAGSYLVVGSWPSLPFLIFHAEGSGRLPVRDVFGLRLQAVEAIDGAAGEFAADVVRPS